MDVYAESALAVTLLGILIVWRDTSRRLQKIQNELHEWHKQWQAAQYQNAGIAPEEARTDLLGA